MTLSEAIAEVRRVTPEHDPWAYTDFAEAVDFVSPTIDEAIAVVLNAIVSGELVTKAEATRLLDDAYLAGFSASGEGYNGEYGWNEGNADWLEKRDRDLSKLICGKP